jgi:hypothetical protein
MQKSFQSFKQGIIKIEDHSILRKGQIVQIISEDTETYTVKPYIASVPQKIKKEDLILN